VRTPGGQECAVPLKGKKKKSKKKKSNKEKELKKKQLKSIRKLKTDTFSE